MATDAIVFLNSAEVKLPIGMKALNDVPTVIIQEERSVVRCVHCDLNQFSTENELCRRCHKSYAAPTVMAVPDVPEPVASQQDVSAWLSATVASTIKHHRDKRFLSQRQLAARMNCPRTYVSKLENDKCTPTLESLYRVTRAFGISMEDFMGDVERAMLALAVQSFQEKEKQG